MGKPYNEGDKPLPGYQLVRFLGRGGFGQVWKSIGPGGIEVALKIIDLQGSAGIKEFRGIRLFKQIRHPNLAPITAFWLKDEAGNLVGESDNPDGNTSTMIMSKAKELLIVMGLGDKNLLDRLKECQAEGKQGIPPEELLNYMEEAAKAIDYLNSPRHELGSGPVAIQHCDIKPQNILIVGGSAQVCDFGLARALSDSRTTAASVSAAYAAPEVLSSNQPSRFTDQYSLAISYIELRTGSLPFNTNFPASILYAHLQGKLDLHLLTEGEQVVIRKATSAKPEDRYPTCLDMVKALRQAFSPKETTPIEVSIKTKYGGQARIGVELVPGYKLIKVLGKGSFGEVWEATAPGGKHVALKIIRNLDAPAGKQEFKALEMIKGIDHNNLMELHAYWLIDREGQIITDDMREQPKAPQAATLVIAGKLAKKNLGQRLKECQEATGKGIPVGELLNYIRDTAIAVDFLNTPQHQLGNKIVAIQHRDIKPENILLAEGGAKVADFGLAKVLEDTSAIVHSESAGLTMAYAAPELFKGRVTQWTDQYALAITYYQLRTGVLPFSGVTSANDVVQIHVQGKLVFDRVPKPEANVLHRATALIPENRYPNCMDFYQDIYQACLAEDVLDEAGMEVPPGSSGALARRSITSGSGTGLGRSSSTSAIPKSTSRSSVQTDKAIAKADTAYTGHEGTQPAFGREQPTVPGAGSPANHGGASSTVRSDQLDDGATVRISEHPGFSPKRHEPQRKGWQEQAEAGTRARKPSSNHAPLIVVLMIVLALSGGGVGVWLYLKNQPKPEPFETWVAKPFEAGQWKEILDRLNQERELPEPQKEQWRSKVGHSWSRSIIEKYKNIQGKTDLEELATSSQDYLGYFPQSSEISDVLGNVKKRLTSLVVQVDQTKPTQPTQSTQPKDTKPVTTVPQTDRSLEQFRIVVKNVSDPFDWKQHLNQCKELQLKFPQDFLVKLALAEALIETSNDSTPISVQAVRDLLAEANEATLEKNYATYIRALLDRHNRSARLSADKIMEIPVDDPFFKTSTHRKAQAVGILLDATLPLRSNEQSFRAPFANDLDAQAAWKWLHHARLIQPNKTWPTSQEITELLAAEATKQPVDTISELLKRVTARLDFKSTTTGIERAEVYRLQLQHPPKELDQQVKTADMAVELLNLLKKEAPNLDIVELFNNVYQPSFKLESLITPQEKQLSAESLANYHKNMATLHDQLGMLILDNLYTPMPMFEGKHKERAVQEFSRAIDLQPDIPEYYIHRASARGKLNRNDELEAILKDGEKARSLNAELPGSYGWIGYARHQQARQQLDLQNKEKLLRDVLKLYDQAIQLSSTSEQNKTEWTTWKINRSSAYVELANSLSDKNQQTLKTERGNILDKAIKDAQEAIRNNPNYPELAYEALGNAHEDMAMFTHRFEHYKLADEAFDQAIRARRDLPHSYVARGRCLYRAIMDEAEQKTNYSNAINYLNQAINKGKDTIYGAEARYWLGKIFIEQGQYQRAEEEFQLSLDSFTRFSRTDWVVACYRELAINAARNAVATRLTGNDPLGTQGFSLARKYIDALEKLHAPSGKEVKIIVLRLEAQTAANVGFLQQNQQKKDQANQAYQRSLHVIKELAELGDTAESGRLEIEVLAYQGKLQEAYELSKKKLPRSLEAIKPAEMELLLKQAELMLNENLPSANEIKPEQILKVLERCEELLKSNEINPALIGVFNGRIGEYYSRLIFKQFNTDQPTSSELKKLKRSYTEKTVKFLKEGLRLKPNYSEAWIWRSLLTQQYLEEIFDPANDTPAQRQDLLKKCDEAIKLLSEVQSDPIFKQLSVSIRRQISETKEKFEKKKKMLTDTPPS